MRIQRTRAASRMDVSHKRGVREDDKAETPETIIAEARREKENEKTKMKRKKIKKKRRKVRGNDDKTKGQCNVRA